jgi:hypothetical protein
MRELGCAAGRFDLAYVRSHRMAGLIKKDLKPAALKAPPAIW